jgi:hypothetical protein
MLDRFGGRVVITLVILSLLTAFILIGLLVARRRRRVDRLGETIPLFPVPSSSPTRIARPASSASRVGRKTPPAVHDHSSATRRDTAEHAVVFAPPSATIRTRDGGVSTLPLPSNGEPHRTTDPQGGETFDGASVRYWRPADGTLQFLPGRLEIAAGRDVGQEIRFVRTAGPDGTRITFGRAEGAPYRHVQLREPTVSRAHAQMTLEQASTSTNGSASRGTTGTMAPRWRLENMSGTNPVIVNGQPLGSNGAVGASVILAEGDRIEMGEVAFIFHSR